MSICDSPHFSPVSSRDAVGRDVARRVSESTGGVFIARSSHQTPLRVVVRRAGLPVESFPSSRSAWICPFRSGRPQPPDADGDGLPDAWEDVRGLDKDDPADSRRLSPSGYSHLELYLHELAAERIRAAASRRP